MAYGCLIALLLFIVMPVFYASSIIFHTFWKMRRTLKKTMNAQQNPGSGSNDKQEQASAHTSQGNTANGQNKKIIQDDEGEYVDFEEI